MSVLYQRHDAYIKELIATRPLPLLSRCVPSRRGVLKYDHSLHAKLKIIAWISRLLHGVELLAQWLQLKQLSYVVLYK